MSNRQKKKMVQEGVAKLRRNPNWNPESFHKTNPIEQLRALDQEVKTSEAYLASCSLCTEARASSGDETALCPQHLQEALGF